MTTGNEDLLIGRLALHYKLITEDQLAEATRQQSREGGARKIGQILIESGLLSAGRFEQLLAAQKEILAKRLAAAAASGGAGGTAVSPPPRPQATSAAARLQPVVPEGAGGNRLDRVLEFAVRQEASDIHVHGAAPLRFRRHGRLQQVDSVVLDPAATERAIREILTPDQEAVLAQRGQIDFAYTIPGVSRFRANVYRQQRGLDAVFRALPNEPPTLSDLGLPLSLARFANFHQGMVLVTGPAGCGKSSTLAAMINIVNEERRDHIVTIEDPIEILHPSKRCLVNQRQVGRHTSSFARALRAALREDPDVIAIGELRDLETISLALTAAETGHLVLATLHTNNAVRTINRILGVFPPSQQDQIRTMVAESLRAVISQRLVARADGAGRVPALEVLVANKAVGHLIRDNKAFQIKSVLQTGGAHGMCLLDSSLADLVKSGAITRGEALRHAEEPSRFAASGPGLAAPAVGAAAGAPGVMGSAAAQPA
ncbi:MAG TPA: type IV pilus twitching motility protein PilT [Thermoanaerobaculia bacterium]|nr:type IV pilus twitching motility protein PilT [Thermoanaerobaculia bacterium]